MLTRAIFAEGCKSVAAGMNPMDLRRGINLAVDHILADLKVPRASPFPVRQLRCSRPSLGRASHPLRLALCPLSRPAPRPQSRTKMISSKEEIKNVATISANSDHAIGQLIADAMEKVGKEGVITVQDGKTLEDELEVVEGMKFDRGYISPCAAPPPLSRPPRPRRRAAISPRCRASSDLFRSRVTTSRAPPQPPLSCVTPRPSPSRAVARRRAPSP